MFVLKSMNKAICISLSLCSSCPGIHRPEMQRQEDLNNKVHDQGHLYPQFISCNNLQFHQMWRSQPTVSFLFMSRYASSRSVTPRRCLPWSTWTRPCASRRCYWFSLTDPIKTMNEGHEIFGNCNKIISPYSVFFSPGMHRPEAGHQEDVCHEVHEQGHVHPERCGPQRPAGAGDPPNRWSTRSWSTSGSPSRTRRTCSWSSTSSSAATSATTSCRGSSSMPSASSTTSARSGWRWTTSEASSSSIGERELCLFSSCDVHCLGNHMERLITNWYQVLIVGGVIRPCN